MKTRHHSFFLFMIMVGLVFSTVAMPSSAIAAPSSSITAASSCSYVMTPQIRIPQYPGQEHLNFLYAPVTWNGAGTYVIVNTYTRIGYTQSQFAFHGNFSGRARFGVPTRYTLLNPRWMADRWVIIFSQCP